MDVVQDRRGHAIHITKERWMHIYERHPEVMDCEEQVLKTVRSGRRNQQPLEPGVFKYSKSYDGLPENHTQKVVVVKFGQTMDERGQIKPDTFVITAYMK